MSLTTTVAIEDILEDYERCKRWFQLIEDPFWGFLLIPRTDISDTDRERLDAWRQDRAHGQLIFSLGGKLSHTDPGLQEKWVEIDANFSGFTAFYLRGMQKLVREDRFEFDSYTKGYEQAILHAISQREIRLNVFEFITADEYYMQFGITNTSCDDFFIAVSHKANELSMSACLV
jgi:hypothetical protein